MSYSGSTPSLNPNALPFVPAAHRACQNPLRYTASAGERMENTLLIEPANCSEVSAEAANGAFTCFEKVPVELRLKIWRAAFPPGRVINIGLNLTLNSQNPWSLTHETGTPPLPITLSINQESRQETLKHYCVIFRQDLAEQDQGGKSLNRLIEGHRLQHPTWKEFPLCFNFARDSLSAYPTELDFWCSYLDSTIPGQLKSLKRLEIHDLCGCHLRPEQNRYGEVGTILSAIHKFTGLEFLRLTFYEEADY